MNSDFRCPKCSHSGEKRTLTCEKCGLIFGKFKGFNNPHSEKPDHHVPYDSFKLNLLALPFMFLIAFFISKNSGCSSLAWTFMVIPMHEIGHAVAAWSTSRPAIPIGAIMPAAGFTSILWKSNLFGVVYGAFSGYGLFQSIKHRRYFPLVILSLALVAFVKLSFFSNEATEIHAITIGGIWGEIVLSTILILSFFQPFLIRYRYDFFRFIALFWGSNVFIHAWDLWSRSAKNVYYLPMGSYIDGPDSQNGDLQKLIHQFHWESVHLAKTTLSLVHVCVAIILAQYLWSLYRSRREKSFSESK